MFSSTCSPIPTDKLLLLLLSEPVSNDIDIQFVVIIGEFAIGIFTKMAKSACPFSVLGQAIETRPGVQQDPHCFRLSCLSKAWCWSRNRMPSFVSYVKHYHSCPSSDGFVNLRTRSCEALRRELSTGGHLALGVSCQYPMLNGNLIFSSRLYSEKAYVLSRGFVRRALEIPLGSVGSEIQWMYFTNKRLEKVVCDAEALIDKSKSSERSETGQDLAVPRLSGGGIITLERTLNKLKNILESHNRGDISY